MSFKSAFEKREKRMKRNLGNPNKSSWSGQDETVYQNRRDEIIKTAKKVVKDLGY